MRIVVLGATGNVGTAVLHRLQAADEVSSIVAYAHAASTAMGMVAVCWALTAAVAALDVVRRRRAARAA